VTFNATVVCVAASVLLLGCKSPAPAPTKVTTPPTFTGDFVDLAQGGKVDVLPKLLHEEYPRYPRHLAESGKTAQVRVAFIVETDGRTSQVQIVETTNPAFSESVREAYSRCTYSPAIKDGHPVRVALEMPVEFQLQLWPLRPGAR
jgi:TonB family protein